MKELSYEQAEPNNTMGVQIVIPNRWSTRPSLLLLHYCHLQRQFPPKKSNGSVLLNWHGRERSRRLRLLFRQYRRGCFVRALWRFRSSVQFQRWERLLSNGLFCRFLIGLVLRIFFGLGGRMHSDFRMFLMSSLEGWIMLHDPWWSWMQSMKWNGISMEKKKSKPEIYKFMEWFNYESQHLPGSDQSPNSHRTA